ncbi:alpha/beta fold hydrolase [Streptomyces brasiliensis]|uniref:alpha/beta fold hydrolase n=1 Tax=Streptomyces brasiliensis TaxID=1954 RepID=UPI001E2CB51E
MDTIRRFGVRLITVDRPGLGASSADDGWTLRDWALGIREFAQVQRAEGMAAIGFSMGAPFALACGAARVVTGVSLVSATDELAHPALASALEPEAAVLVKQVATRASSAELLLRDAADADILWEATVGTSHDADQRIFADPAFEQNYRRALTDGFAQGGAGYARETVLALSRWPFDPSTITVPVDLWYADRDTNPLHSPDLGAFLAQRIPTARRFVVPYEGSMLLWTHTDAILRSLLTRIAQQ